MFQSEIRNTENIISSIFFECGQPVKYENHALSAVYCTLAALAVLFLVDYGSTGKKVGNLFIKCACVCVCVRARVTYFLQPRIFRRTSAHSNRFGPERYVGRLYGTPRSHTCQNKITYPFMRRSKYSKRWLNLSNLYFSYVYIPSDLYSRTGSAAAAAAVGNVVRTRFSAVGPDRVGFRRVPPCPFDMCTYRALCTKSVLSKGGGGVG